MIRYECKKLISNKFILGLFVLLFLLNALLSYSEAKHDPATDLSEDVLDNASYFGRIFARCGGLADAVAQGLKEQWA